MTKKNPMLWIHHNLLNYSSIVGLLALFRCFAMMQKVVTTHIPGYLIISLIIFRGNIKVGLLCQRLCIFCIFDSHAQRAPEKG